MSVRVNYAALSAAVRQSPSLRAGLQPLAARCTRVTRQVADERTQRRTGQMEANYRSSVIPGGVGPVVARIRTENPVPHALFMEAGTRPHRIPKAGERLLSWVHGGVRITIYGHVNHPGTAPRNIIRDALRRVAAGTGI